MKITFTQDEVDALSEDMAAKLDDELSVTVESLNDFSDEFESVDGLKSALQKERENARKFKSDWKAAQAKLTLAEQESDPEGEIATLTAQRDKLQSDLETVTGERDQLRGDITARDTDAKIATAVAKANGDLDLLRPHVRSMLEENPDTDLDQAMTSLKDKHPGAFKATSQSGGGNGPEGDRPLSIQTQFRSGATLRRSQMSDKDKIEYQKVHGIDGLLALPE